MAQDNKEKRKVGVKSSFKDLARQDPSNKYFFKQLRAKEKLIFVAYPGRIEGVIERINKYELRLKERDELLPKHDILFLYKPGASKAVEQGLTIDEKVVKEQLEPLIKLTERLEIPEDVLKKSFNEKRQIEITLRNGQVLKGRIHSYGIYSIRLELNKDSRVIIMRPNIYNLNYRNATS
jgi:sRNA-binding regulator protein Hfq